MKEAALEEFESCATFQSLHLRSNAYAALGAAEVVTGRGQVQPAVELLDRASSLIATAARATIGWPETRLTYDNARIPEALIAAGIALGDARRTSLGIRLLDWLALNESQGNRFSFTPVGGREPGVHEPGFDQQPIEAWAMADACYRAWSVTGESRWARRALRAACWLLGNNDKDALLYDAESGGTFDGLNSRWSQSQPRGGIDAGRHRDTPGRGELLARPRVDPSGMCYATRVFLASFAARLAFLSCLFCLRSFAATVLVFLPPLSLLPMRASKPWHANCDRHLGIVSHPQQREEGRGQEEAPRDHLR